MIQMKGQNMASVTVVVTSHNTDEKGLRWSLESLIEQTVEDFDVIMVDDGTTEAAEAVFAQYCKDYDGFATVRSENKGTAASRNAGALKAKGDFLLFLDGGDYLSPETVERFRQTQEESKADIVCNRYYYSGEGEPGYDSWSEQICVVPVIDKLDRALINTCDLDGKLYSRRFFDLYSLRFPEQAVAYNAWFTMKCALSGAKIAGCAGAIYEKKTNPLFGEAKPTAESFRTFTAVYDEILSWMRAVIEEDTGSLDGDEYAYQEILTVYFQLLTDRFYRAFWYLDDAVLELLRQKLEELSAPLQEERRKKINEKNIDIRFPAMYIRIQDAVDMPLFSMLIDINETEKLDALIRSFYCQKFPFFDLWVRQSDYDSGYYPAEWKNAPNLHLLPDEGFFNKARQDCAGIPINVKDETPVDSTVLSELAIAKMPRSLVQYKFAALRKTKGAKTYLKGKGFNIR